MRTNMYCGLSYVRCLGEAMRRMVAVLIVTMMLPTISVSANTTPFDFFIDESGGH